MKSCNWVVKLTRLSNALKGLDDSCPHPRVSFCRLGRSTLQSARTPVVTIEWNSAWVRLGRCRRICVTASREREIFGVNVSFFSCVAHMVISQRESPAMLPLRNSRLSRVLQVVARLRRTSWFVKRWTIALFILY